jgi:hypothetical protein
MDIAYYLPAVSGGCLAAVVLWMFLCRESLKRGKIGISDVLILILFLGIVFGIASWLQPAESAK